MNASGRIIRRGGGVKGGDSITFIRVDLESALPPTAAEDTIAILSTTAINKVYVAPTRPATGSVSGDVWIEGIKSSMYPINVDDTNFIYVHLSAVCQQYINGAWATKQIRIFKSAAWHSFTFIYYNYGDVSSAITGDWSVLGSGAGKGSNYLYCWGYGNSGSVIQQSCITTNYLIDFSKVNTIYLTAKYSGGGTKPAAGARLVLTSVKAGSVSAVNGGIVASKTLTTNSTPTAHSFDVVGVTGSFYITLIAYTAASYEPAAYVYEMWGE